MMSRKRVLLLVGALLLLLVGIGILRSYQTPARSLPLAPSSTMQAAYDALKQASSIPVQVQLQHGVARFVEASIPTRGVNPAERARDYLKTFGALYGLTPSSSVELITRRVTKGAAEENTVVFAERYQGVPIFGGELLVSLQGDHVYSTVGSIFHPTTPFSVIPTLTSADAIKKAQAFLHVGTVKTYADPQLEIFDLAVSASASVSSSEPHLAWRVFFETPTPRELHLDATTGVVLTTFDTQPEDYSLDLEDANGSEATATNACYHLTSADDWIGDEDGLLRSYHSDRDAAGAWLNLRNTYNFFWNTFHLDSYDNDGEDIEAYVHAGGGVVGAAANYNTSCDVFQFSTGNVGYDVTAHEFTHAIIAQTSNLTYQNQSGALNESFSDIMGSSVDGNWLVGEGRTGGGRPFRDMENPRRYVDPDTMPPIVMTADNGGVHVNSGIHNKVAFLIADGGVHNGQQVQGIGRPKMQQLMFNVMRTLPSSAQFNDGRNRAVAVADFWARTHTIGFTTHDACMVRNAYYAAGFRGTDDTARADADCDGIEDARDPDRDNDAIPDIRDNCPLTPNIDQRDTDGDTIGDACDNDADNDGVPDAIDNCPTITNPGQEASPPGNILGYACSDEDHDGVLNVADNCAFVANPDQSDLDHDGYGDVCDADMDNDHNLDDYDNCPRIANPDQADRDHDGIGDTCDNCLSLSNRNQQDHDHDGIGDACDNDRDGDGVANAEDPCPDSTYCVSSMDMSSGTFQLEAGSSPRIVRTALTMPLCPDCGPIPPVTHDDSVCQGFRIQDAPAGTRFWLTDETGRFTSRFRQKDDHLIMSFTPEGGRAYTLHTLITKNTKAPLTINLRSDDTACTTEPDNVTRVNAKKADPSLPPPASGTKIIPTSTKKELITPPKEETLQKITPPLPEPPVVSLQLIAPTKELYYGVCSKDLPTVFHLIFHTQSTTPLKTISLTYQTFHEDGSIAHAERNIQVTSIGNDDYAIDLDTTTFAIDDLNHQNGLLRYRILLLDSAGLKATHEGDLSLLACQQKQ